MAEPSAEQRETTRRYLTFRMDERLYAISADAVSEVIRTPSVARVPLSPKSLLGVANLRGSVLPIASLRGLLGREEVAASSSSRAIVLEGDAPVGLAVDAVGVLVTIGQEQIETRQAQLAAEPGERLIGAFQAQGPSNVAKILDLRGLLDAAFVQVAAPRRSSTAKLEPDGLNEAAGEAAHFEKIVSFDVAGQEFALNLMDVREVVTEPHNLTAAPHSEALVRGVMAYRDTLLPVLSLHGLLGLPAPQGRDSRAKVIVVSVHGVLVGLLADRMRAILPADPALIEPTPPMLAARAGGEAKIKAIYRGDGGERLISIVDTEQLFREDVMARLNSAELSQISAPDAGTSSAGDLAFLVFRLADDEFALPIAAVDEVSRVPDQITRLPKTPNFLEGVVNLRGDVLPVIDQRRRFDMPPAPLAEARRLVVVRTDQLRAGLIVDSVSEVLRVDADAMEPAPYLTGEPTRLVHGVVNLQAADRLILVLDAAELLSRAERGLLDAFQDRA